MSETPGTPLFPELPPRLPTPQEVLRVPLAQPNDAHAATVRDYLTALLRTLWRETDEFSGKRPFGGSDWDYDLYAALGRAGMVDITFDEDGYVDTFAESAQRQAARMIAAAIEALGEPPAEVTR